MELYVLIVNDMEEKKVSERREAVLSDRKPVSQMSARELLRREARWIRESEEAKQKEKDAESDS